MILTLATSLLIVGIARLLAIWGQKLTLKAYSPSKLPIKPIKDFMSEEIDTASVVSLSKHRKLSIDDLKSMGIKIEE